MLSFGKHPENWAARLNLIHVVHLAPRQPHLTRQVYICGSTTEGRGGITDKSPAQWDRAGIHLVSCCVRVGDFLNQGYRRGVPFRFSRFISSAHLLGRVTTPRTIL